MSTAEYIDLSGNEPKFIKTLPTVQNLNGFDIRKAKLPIRPKAAILKCIGLSLIKYQYGDRISLPPKSDQVNGHKKKDTLKSDVWSSAWFSDEKPSFSKYPLRHILEEDFIKSFKCPHRQSALCKYNNKMNRINYIHHIRCGHLNIDSSWKRFLKHNQQKDLGTIFEIACILCSKNQKNMSLSPVEFIKHIKKVHSNLMPYTDYFAFFQNCYVCNDETKSIFQNINHRQTCLVTVTKKPNNICTKNFNNCSKRLQDKIIVCIELENDPKNSFDTKLKSFVFFKRTALFHWINSKKKLRHKESGFQITNGQEKNAQKYDVNFSPYLNKFSHSIATNSFIIESDWVAPGANSIDYMKHIDKFFIPVPFPLKNDIKIKESYNDWIKLIHPNKSAVLKVNPWYCELCNGMIKNINTAYSHLRICHGDVTFMDNQCKSCNKRFITTQGYRLHFQEFKNCPVARKCGLCGTVVPINDIYQHLSNHHQNNFPKVLQLKNCLICRAPISDVKKHLFDVHSISNALPGAPDIGHVRYRNGAFYSCSQCAFTFFSEIELRNHMITVQHHLKCVECPEKKFYLFWELMQHKESFHKDSEKSTSLTCEICTANNTTNDCKIATFTSPSDKVDHFLQMHDSRCRVVLTDLEMQDGL